jgi:acetyl-CoA carboxylase biotin carboxyl carrier protein
MAIEVRAHITGTVWKIELTAGAAVSEGDVIIILESMKMEMPVEAPGGGTLTEVLISEGQAVTEGQVLALIEEG